MSLAANESKASNTRSQKKHYSSYLAEFKWRYIHSGEDLWKAFLDNASNENNKVTVSNEQCENEFQDA